MFETLDVECRIERIDDGIVVHLFGAIDLTRCISLARELSRIQRDGPDRLVIDFAGVSTIDSSVVATLVETLRVARRRDGLLVLSSMSPYVRGIFEVTGLADGPFFIEETLADAVARPHRRRFDRVTVGDVTCNRGTVLDLSTGGVRLRSPRRLRGAVHLTLRSGPARVEADATVAWTHRLGFARHEVGLEFVEPPASARRMIGSLVAESNERADRES